MNRAVVLFICGCLAGCAVALYFRPSRSISTPAANIVAMTPVTPPPVVSSPSPAVATVPASPSAASPAPAPAQTNDASLRSKWDARRDLMARLREWAARDLAGALDYVSKMPPGSDRDDAFEALCYGLASKDPARAVTLAQSLQEPEAVVENIVQQWAGGDLPGAMVWANSQPAGAQRDELFQRIALVLSPSDPQDAAGLVLEQIPSGQDRDEAMMTVLNQWANRDLKGAALWVQNFPDGPLRERAVAELQGVQQFQQDVSRQ